jgi:hypothetical protein
MTIGFIARAWSSIEVALNEQLRYTNTFLGTGELSAAVAMNTQADQCGNCPSE